MLRELARSYLTIVKDLSRIMNRLKALYRSWVISLISLELCNPAFQLFIEGSSESWPPTYHAAGNSGSAGTRGVVRHPEDRHRPQNWK
jgi:hypothetical protein